jgi:hypothetical protein
MPGSIFPVQVTTVLNTIFYRFRPGKLHTRSIRVYAQLVDCGETHFISNTKLGVQALLSSTDYPYESRESLQCQKDC